MKKPLEKDIQRDCLKWLSLNGWLAWRNNSGGRVVKGAARNYFIKLGPTGSGDILAIKDGVFLSLEVKRPGNSMTEEQKSWIDLVRKQGGLAFCVYSVSDLISELG